MRSVVYHKILAKKYEYMQRIGYVKNLESEYFVLDFSRLNSNAKLG